MHYSPGYLLSGTQFIKNILVPFGVNVVQDVHSLQSQILFIYKQRMHGYSKCAWCTDHHLIERQIIVNPPPKGGLSFEKTMRNSDVLPEKKRKKGRWAVSKKENCITYRYAHPCVHIFGKNAELDQGWQVISRSGWRAGSDARMYVRSVDIV